MRMIEDALENKFDLILTKSISRFARNTLDTLKYVRLLKENNVATTKLMKQGMNLNKEFSKCDVISPEMFEGYKQQLITLKNAQEEIGKYEERNRLTIDDIRSEIETQNDSSAEIKDALESIYNYID